MSTIGSARIRFRSDLERVDVNERSLLPQNVVQLKEFFLLLPLITFEPIRQTNFIMAKPKSKATEEVTLNK
jgi:hypothetical protein